MYWTIYIYSCIFITTLRHSLDVITACTAAFGVVSNKDHTCAPSNFVHHSRLFWSNKSSNIENDTEIIVWKCE